mgnify:CR=1 FL=1
MYKKGELRVDTVSDTRTDDYDDVYGAVLPHSCSSWVIGGPEQIKALIEDLQNVLVVLEKKPAEE